MITLRFFAQLADAAGARVQRVDAAPTPQAILAGAARLDFVNPASVRVAVNGRWAQWSTPLRDGDDVAFLPPSNAL